MLQQRRDPRQITVLGGGPAGLTAGYYAKRYGLRFKVYEASSRVGGNSVTLRHDEFSFDSGAHLFQTKDPEVLDEVSKLLEGGLDKVTLPHQTYYDGLLLEFPFSPWNLMTTVGLRTVCKATYEIINEKFRDKQLDGSFESHAIRHYGKTIAEQLLLTYSRKLWGIPCSELSAKIAGRRLNGLDWRRLLIEAALGSFLYTEPPGGPYYYPRKGIGTIAEKLADFCGKSNIYTNSRITGILHDHRRIQAVEINGERTVTDEVLSTLPLGLFLRLMKPTPPADILDLAKGLNFRCLILVVIFAKRDLVTKGLSIHFPDPQIPFTRIHEPKNRSRQMAPDGKTSLVAEIPCKHGDQLWNSDDHALRRLVISELIKLRWLGQEDVLGGVVVRLSNAYPILTLGYEHRLRRVSAYLGNFPNLRLAGRGGAFMYTSFPDLMKASKEIVTRYMRPEQIELKTERV